MADMMVGMVARGVDNDTHLSDDGTAPLTPPKCPREPGDDLDETALVEAGILGGPDHRTLNVCLVCEVLAHLRSEPTIVRAMGSPRSTQHPDIAALLGEVDLLAETRAVLVAPPPPLSRGGVTLLLSFEVAARASRSVVVQVASAAIMDGADGIFRVRLKMSDGEQQTPALLDSRLHRSLCRELLEATSGEDEGGVDVGGDPRPPVVGAVWCLSAWTRFQSATGVEVIVLHEAAPLPGCPAGADVVGSGELIDAVAAIQPPPAPTVPADTTTDGVGEPGQPGHVPTVTCDGCDCDKAWGKVLTSFDYDKEHPSTFAHVGCRAPALPPVEEVWEEMCERYPGGGPYEDDPCDAPAGERRFALYYYVATNWYDARGSGNRSMLPRCIWAAIRALHPSDEHDEGMPDAADYTPPDPDSNASGNDTGSGDDGNDADEFWL